MSLNRIILIGRLTRDPEMKYTPQGIAVAQMGIAVDRFTKNEQGEYETDFFNVVAWRRSAEFASNYLKKGRLVSVDGRLQSRSWVDQTSGQKRTVYEIVAENIQGLDKRGDAEPMSDSEVEGGDTEARSAAPARTPAAAPARSAPPSRAAAPRAAAPPDDDIDESDPFADE
jgi:single-strand DNA-binding protein